MNTLREQSDTQLMTLLQQGSEPAFAELYDRYQPLVRRFAGRIAKSGEAAEEIVQNVFLKLWLQREYAQEISNPAGWLARVAANEACDFLRRIARERILAEKVWTDMLHEPAYTENTYVLKDYLHLLEEAVSALPPQQQKIYRLSREKYLTYDEIARELNLSANTVRNHMAAALENIRKYLARNAALCALPPSIALLLLLGKP